MKEKVVIYAINQMHWNEETGNGVGEAFRWLLEDGWKTKQMSTEVIDSKLYIVAVLEKPEE